MDLIKSEIKRLAKKINARKKTLPTFGSSEDFARPHIEKTGNIYHWVVVERGQEQENLVKTLKRYYFMFLKQ